MQFTVGSLFAGIGGIDLGFERAGFKTAWQVEIDPWCRKVLAKHFPDAERFDDVRTVGLHNLSPVDVIVGGFPCQDISNAGKRAGITGDRSGLWSEYARIISELRPRFVFVENVPGLLSSGMGTVIGNLAQAGYDAEWDVVSAADVGAKHLRERLWIIAYPHGKGLQERLLQPGVPEEARCASFRQDFTVDAWWTSIPRVLRRFHGVPKRVDRIRGLGNAVVPQIPEMFAHRIHDALTRPHGARVGKKKRNR